jgi:hypothetical protein
MRRPLSLAAVVLCLALPAAGFASSSSPHSSKPSSSSSKVHVKGYYKKDGTYVPPHERSEPGTGSHTETTPHTTTSSHSTSASGSHSTAGTGSHGCKTCPRDEHGRIKRSEKAKEDFMKNTGYPHGRPGYVVDHIVPLECGGADNPANMQWQTVAEAKAKDKTEGNCRR